jgi:hypothetical protein
LPLDVFRRYAAKAIQVKNYHEASIRNFLQLVGVLGIDHPDKLSPDMIWRRVDNGKAKTYAALNDYLQSGELIRERVPDSFAQEWQMASAEHF